MTQERAIVTLNANKYRARFGHFSKFEDPPKEEKKTFVVIKFQAKI